MIVKVGPIIIRVETHLGNVGRVSKAHKEAIDLLLSKEKRLEALRYCRRNVVPDYLTAKSYVEYRERKLKGKQR